LGGAQEIIDGVSDDFLGGTEKAEDVKLPGAGIIPKLCPMERVGMEKMDGNRHHGVRSRTGATCGKARQAIW
jgi:hypothetical protein